MPCGNRTDTGNYKCWSFREQYKKDKCKMFPSIQKIG